MEAQKQHPFPRSSGFWGFRFFARIIGFGGNPQPIQGLRLNNMAIRRSPYFLIRRNNYVNQSDHRLNGIPVGVAEENHDRSQQDTEALLDVISQEAVPRGYPSLPEGRKLIRAKKRCAWIINFQILQQQIGTSRVFPFLPPLRREPVCGRPRLNRKSIRRKHRCPQTAFLFPRMGFRTN